MNTTLLFPITLFVMVLVILARKGIASRRADMPTDEELDEFLDWKKHQTDLERRQTERRAEEARGEIEAAAVEREIKEAENEAREQEDRRRIKVVPIPAVGAIAGRVTDEPIYDREWLRPGGSVASFFCNYFAYAETPPDGSCKQYGSDTNMAGGMGGMPQGHRMKVTGISLVFDEGTSEADIARLKNGGSLEIVLCQTRWRTFKIQEVFSTDPSKPRVEFSTPLTLEPLEYFYVRLNFWNAKIETWMRATVYLHGKQVKAICG